jgi:hypothetical protein
VILSGRQKNFTAELDYMHTELRPLSLGEILDRTFQLYRSHFFMFVGISMVTAAIDLVWKLIQTGITRVLVHHIAVRALGVVSSGFAFVNLFVYTVASAVAIAATCRAVSAIYLGQSTNMTQAFGEIRAHWFRYVLIFVVAGVLAWGGALLLFIAVLIAATLTRYSGSSMTLLLGLFGLSMLVLIPFGIWMTLRYSLANTASVFEDLGIRGSLKRSVVLSHGAAEKTKIFTVLFLAWALSAVLTWGGLTPVMVLVFRSAAHHVPMQQISLGMTIYTLIVGFITSSLTIPVYAIGLTLFYYDARIRKEGFDVEWMMLKSEDPASSSNPALATPEPAGPSLG